jgi:hypothetical protein
MDASIHSILATGLLITHITGEQTNFATKASMCMQNNLANDTLLQTLQINGHCSMYVMMSLQLHLIPE